MLRHRYTLRELQDPDKCNALVIQKDGQKIHQCKRLGRCPIKEHAKQDVRENIRVLQKAGVIRDQEADTGVAAVDYLLSLLSLKK